MTVRNAGPEAASIEVLPTVWFRNTWSWEPGAPRPELRLEDGAIVAEHAGLGTRFLSAAGGATPP